MYSYYHQFYFPFSFSLLPNIEIETNIHFDFTFLEAFKHKN